MNQMKGWCEVVNQRARVFELKHAVLEIPRGSGHGEDDDGVHDSIGFQVLKPPSFFLLYFHKSGCILVSSITQTKPRQ